MRTAYCGHESIFISQTEGQCIVKTTRAEIAQAALQLMATKGYRGASIGEIEKAVGLAPRAGGFYRHFQSKEEILFDAIDIYSEEIHAELDELKKMRQS